ncbi:cytochrome c biogenesis protein CcmG/thiol:disulfide interchange protein DsbE [Rhodoligotrophos appendicifer]|uniref:DsbE family thiol:disulfide interchange protein n=1 Tax=Rhodoligotrophos appendicifer TaxID=987056 RepID=UPI001185B4A1|nr:DsbE family thiol:disulfide interchange protein [Rhodoligotrophos appendicifer]
MAAEAPKPHGDEPRKRRVLPLAVLPVILFALLAIVMMMRLFGGDPSKLPSPLIGKAVPDFALPGLAGLQAEGIPVPGFSTSDLAKGDVTLVNVWASWCVPCRQEHPILMQLATDPNVKILGINYKDNAENARRFLGLLGNPFRAVGIDPEGKTAVEWGFYGVPETFVVNGKGIITYKWIGPMTADIVQQNILPAITAARAGRN